MIAVASRKRTRESSVPPMLAISVVCPVCDTVSTAFAGSWGELADRHAEQCTGAAA